MARTGPDNALGEKRLLEDAAAGVYERLRSDAAAAPRAIRPAFSYIKRSLFGGFSRQAMEKACPAAGALFPRLFREATGETPAAYGRRRRLEVVAKLLETSDLSLRHIARLVGYASGEGLRLAFISWKDVSPAGWRAEAQVPEASLSEPRDVERHATWRRALAGGADSESVTELLDEALELYPHHQDRRAPGLGSAKKGWTVPGSPAFQRLYEELKVDLVVAALDRPDVRPSTRHHLVEEVPMASYALVDRLLAESANLEGEDPARSAERSELALHALEACRRSRLPGLRGRKVLALARRARAAHAAGKVTEAEEALALLELTDASVVEGLPASVRLEFLEARALSRRLALEKAVAEAEQAERMLGEADA